MPITKSEEPIEITTHSFGDQGGGCMVDAFNLSNGRSIAVTDEYIVIFKGINAGSDRGDDYGDLLVDLFRENPKLIVNSSYSAIKSHDSVSITLNDDTKYSVSELLALENNSKNPSLTYSI